MFSKRSSHYFEVSDSPDNVHSPYYLHSLDHPGLVLTSDKLDGTNYGTWFVTMMNTSIEAKNKLGFIDDDDLYCKIWSRCYSMVKSWLLNSVTKKIYISILCFNSASDIWKDLHTCFHKSNLLRLYKLRQQIHSLRQGSLDLSAYHTSHSSVDSSAFHTQVHSSPVHSGNQAEVHSISAYKPPGYSPKQGDCFFKYFAEVFLIVLVYVDVILIACDNDGAVDHLKHQFQSDILHSQFSEAPRKVHQQVFHKDLAYIKGIVGQGLFYPANSELQLRGYADADYDSCLDTRRSTSGYCFFLGSSLISWKSKKQQIVVKSSAEAEYRSRLTASDELVWLLDFLNELQVHLIAVAFDRDGCRYCFSCSLFQLRFVSAAVCFSCFISITVSAFGQQDGSSHSFRPILRGTIDVYDAGLVNCKLVQV